MQYTLNKRHVPLFTTSPPPNSTIFPLWGGGLSVNSNILLRYLYHKISCFLRLCQYDRKSHAMLCLVRLPRFRPGGRRGRWVVSGENFFWNILVLITNGLMYFLANINVSFSPHPASTYYIFEIHFPQTI